MKTEKPDAPKSGQIIHFPRSRIKRLVRADGTVIELYHRWDEEAAERNKRKSNDPEGYTPQSA